MLEMLENVRNTKMLEDVKSTKNGQTSQELRMLSSVTINCQVRMIV